MKAIFFILLLIIPTTCRAEWPEKWTATDTALELGFLGVTAVDHAQSRYMSRQDGRGFAYINGKWEHVHTGKFYETNPLIGKYPHQDRVDIYFASVYVIHPLVSMAIPKKWAVFNIPVRNIWQSVTIGVESWQIERNFSIGARMRF